MGSGNVPKSKPEFSITIPSYTGAATIDETFDALIAQAEHLQNAEVVVLLDGPKVATTFVFLFLFIVPAHNVLVFYPTDHFKQLWLQHGFIVHVYVDLTLAETQHVMTHYARGVDHGVYDCFALSVSSHGHAGHFTSRDSRGVSIKEDVLIPLKLCASLEGKPKIIAIQACQNLATGTYRHGRIQPEVRTDVPESSQRYVQTCQNPARGTYRRERIQPKVHTDIASIFDTNNITCI